MASEARVTNAFKEHFMNIFSKLGIMTIWYHSENIMENIILSNYSG